MGAGKISGPFLTVDVEEWFHVCGETAYGNPDLWPTFEKRVHVGVDRILELLAPTRSRATFFVLGWVARQSPALVKRIAAAGHEIACHGDLHRRLFEITPEAFRNDLCRSRDVLQEIVGKKVTAFRAPEWSMRTPENPALAILVEEGFGVDSSLVPARPVGLETNPQQPTWLDTPSGRILEVPPLMGSFFFRRAMLGGGVCSRLSRFDRVLAAIDGALAEDRSPVIYFHPWEFDPQHPPMQLSPLGRLVHYGGRSRSLPRLVKLLDRYDFRPISEAAAPAEAFESTAARRGAFA
ncbi:MAG: polysaccharide deacetylase family protein [Thermoanaerobaculia bacterium]